MPGDERVSRNDGPTHLTILPTYRCTAACEQNDDLRDFSDIDEHNDITRL